MHYQTRRSTGSVVTGAVKEASYGFGLQALTTFEQAFSFTLGLLTHELIKEWSDQSWSNQKFFSWLIFMLIAFVLPRFKECYKNYNGDTETSRVSPGDVKAAGNSTHSGYYIT